MPRNKRKHPHSRYERFMLACINTLPFKFHSPGEPNIPGTEKYEPLYNDYGGNREGGVRYHQTKTDKREMLTPTKYKFKYNKKVHVRKPPRGNALN